MKSLSGARFVMGVLLVTLSSAAVVIVWATNKQNNTDRLRVENKTRSLAVESVEEAQGTGRFAVTVRNGYDKPIVAYSIRVEDGSTDKDTISAVERGGLVDEWSVSPDATDIARVSASSGGNVVLTIYAVLFEDGTGDGDTADLMRLRELRAGIKMAYQRIAPVLHRAASETGALVSEEATQSLEGEVASISDKGVPMNLRRGFAQAKDFIRLELKELKEKVRSDPALKYNAEINKKAKAVEKALAKL